MPAAAIVVAAAVVVAFWLTGSDSSEVVTEPQRAEAVMGRLSTEVELSGSALSERSDTLSFEVSGVVASVTASQGDEVREGAALATLDDTDAQRRIETAEVQLHQAQLRLDSLLTDPEASAVASANQAIASAKSQIVGAEQALALLSDPPSAADLASAEQAVASALGQISSAEQALALLSEPPSAADLASAEQAVASALGQISSAEQALALLSEPPSAADLASGEQAVASALGQLSSAEQALATLIAGPSEAEIEESRAAVTQAQIQVTAAATLAEELMEALIEAFDSSEPSDGYCDRYSGLSASDAVIRDTCAATLPLTDVQVETLRGSFEDRSSTYESYGNSLIDANIAFVASDADRESAISALASAEESLTNLLQSITEDDLYQAEQAVEAAKASHTAAVARLEDLRAAADAGDFEQAHASLESARASLASAEAQYNELVSGPTENAIEQQEQEVRLAELSVEEARGAMAELTVFAPYDGVVEAVSVRPGDPHLLRLPRIHSEHVQPDADRVDRYGRRPVGS